MQSHVLTTLVLAATLAGPLQVTAASFDRTTPPPPPSALREMLERPGVADALGPIATAELREAIIALGHGDFTASASFADRVTRGAPNVAVGWHILGLARANAGDYDGALTALARAGDAYRNNGTPDVIRGDILTMLDRLDAAADAYAAGLDKDSGLWPALIGLGDLALARGEPDAALMQFRRAHAIAPTGTAEPMERVAQTLIRLGDTAAADRFLADTAAETGDADTWRRVARLRGVTGDRAGAAEALARARDLAPGDRGVLTESAELARAQGRPEEAATFLAAALDRNPDDPGLAADLARVQIEAGTPEAALATLDRWADASDTAPEPVLSALAVSNAAAGELDTAAAFHAARTARFPSVDSFADRAAFLTAREDLDAAASVLEDAVAAFPKAPELRLQQGRLLAAKRDYTAALAALDRGLVLAPDDPALMRNVSAISRRLGDLDAAQTWASRAAGTADAGIADQIWLGVVAAENGDRPTAVAAYRAVLASDAANVVALNNLAVLLTEDAPDDAVGLARRAVDAAGAQPALLDTLGWALFHAGRLADARATLETALDGRPNAAPTHYRLGRTFAALGDVDAARAAYARALDLDPAFDGASDARQRMKGE